MFVIPNELYVGLQIRKTKGNVISADGGKNVALGFASYKNEKGEIQHPSLEQWRDKDIPRMCYDNTPTIGMSVAGSVKRWSTSNKCIRVEDPRGFQLEITIENFIEIIRNCTLNKGVIRDEMVWGWDGSTVKLIKVGSEDYNTGIENFNVKMSASISLKDIKPGYIVRLKNGKVGKYLGAWYIIVDDYSNKFVGDILSHNLSRLTMTKRHYLIDTGSDIIYSPSIVIKKIEKSDEEDISSIKSYLEEKIKKTMKYSYSRSLADREVSLLNVGWGDSRIKSIYVKHNLTENGWNLLGEDEIPYSWKKLVFASDKKLTRNDLEILVKKDIKNFI